LCTTRCKLCPCAESAQARKRLAARALSPAGRQHAAPRRRHVREGGRRMRAGAGALGRSCERACVRSLLALKMDTSARGLARNQPGGPRAPPPCRSPAASRLAASCGPVWAGLLLSSRSRVGVGPARPELQRCGVRLKDQLRRGMKWKGRKRKDSSTDRYGAAGGDSWREKRCSFAQNDSCTMSANLRSVQIEFRGPSGRISQTRQTSETPLVSLWSLPTAFAIPDQCD
jgi:hypothetical protein